MLKITYKLCSSLDQHSIINKPTSQLNKVISQQQKHVFSGNNLKHNLEISDFVGNCVQQIEANLGKWPIYEQTMWLSCHGFWFVSACKFTDSCNLVYFFTPRSACRLHLDQKWFLCAQFKFCSNTSCMQTVRPSLQIQAGFINEQVSSHHQFCQLNGRKNLVI